MTKFRIGDIVYSRDYGLIMIIIEMDFDGDWYYATAVDNNGFSRIFSCDRLVIATDLIKAMYL